MGRLCKSFGRTAGTLLWLIFCGVLLNCAKKPLQLLLAMMIHEISHIICGILLGGRLPRVEINMVGLRLSYSGIYSCGKRIAVSLSGPIVSILMGLFHYFGTEFSLYSLSLGIINLLPISALDGGCALRVLAFNYLMPARAERVCKVVSVLSTLILFAVNCAVQLRYSANLSLAALTIFLTVTVLGRE